MSPRTESARKVASKRAACKEGGWVRTQHAPNIHSRCRKGAEIETRKKREERTPAHCIFRREQRYYIHNPVRNGSLRPMSSAGSFVLASPTCKSHSRNACSGVLGRLGANPARRQACAPPALRLCSWVTSQWGQWLRSPTAEVALVSAHSTNAVIEIDWA